MKTFVHPARTEWSEIFRRPAASFADLEKPVRKILQEVERQGDRAVKKYTRAFDGVALKSLRVSEKEIREAAGRLPENLKSAMQLARKNLETFHRAQQEEITRIETMPGVCCWRRSVPIERVGLYIPGGSAPLFSTVLMLGVPASLAGCREILLCTPPGPDGELHPAILYAAELCGIENIFKAGGAQAVGAMAFGTETIPAVYKIFGPGNPYVTLAKQLVQQKGIAIDMPAGPSELMVIADETAIPEYVAADLLSQAEHGPDSQVILVSTSQAFAQQVSEVLAKQLALLPRKEIAAKALSNSRQVLASKAADAIEMANYYAPEHLVLCCREAEDLALQVSAAGSVFIGNYSPEAAGDYASGTNHTLPTHGYAAMYSGVSLDSFVKKITYQQLSREGLKNIAPAVMAMAEAEGLEAHKYAIAIRLNDN